MAFRYPVPGAAQTPISQASPAQAQAGMPPAMISQIPPQLLLSAEESYIENILRMNLGKIATFYLTFENNREWNALVVKGRIEAAGRDHIIVSEPETGKRHLLLMVNLDYITFDEALNYVPPPIPGFIRQRS